LPASCDIDPERQLHERKALPALEGPRPVPREVRQAINKKAHAPSLHAYEKNREYLERYVRRYLDDPARQLDCVHALDLDDGKQTLWSLCSMLSTLEVVTDNVKARMASVETRPLSTPSGHRTGGKPPPGLSPLARGMIWKRRLTVAWRLERYTITPCSALYSVLSRENSARTM